MESRKKTDESERLFQLAQEIENRLGNNCRIPGEKPEHESHRGDPLDEATTLAPMARPDLREEVEGTV